MNNLYETGIRPLVDDFLALEAAKIRDYGSYWSASSAGYCMRKVIFDRLKVPEVNPDPRKQRVFSAGHIFHEWMQGLTKKAGISVAQEVELVDDKLMIKGHFDDLVLISLDESGTQARMGDEIRKQNLILYDYKTVNSQAFKYKKDKISHYHMMQLGTYMYMLRTFKKLKDSPNELWNIKGLENLTESRICNISKDDLRMSEVQLLWTPALEKLVYEYWSTLNGYWNKKQIPKCTCADYEINAKTGVGFMADERYNPYFYEGEPCSVAWLSKHPDLIKEWKNA